MEFSDTLQFLSDSVLKAFWYEVLRKFEKDECEQSLIILTYIEDELKRRSDITCSSNKK